MCFLGSGDFMPISGEYTVQKMKACLPHTRQLPMLLELLLQLVGLQCSGVQLRVTR